MFEELTRFRHEYKYIEPEVNLIALQSRLHSLLKLDHNVSEKGFYSIRSLYFDDYHDSNLYEKIDGVDERTKWRIRIYDRDDNKICLERKARKANLISKDICLLGKDDYEKIVTGRLKIGRDKPPLLNVFAKEMAVHVLRPAVIVEYDRTPFVCSDGNTRVTIDRNIRSSSEISAFLEDRRLASRPVLAPGQNLLEVKFDSFLPGYIAHAIEHGRMRNEAFSKYYLARKFTYNGLTTGGIGRSL